MTVEDVDHDGQYEARASARFAMGCNGEPFTETIVLKIEAESVTRMATTEPDSPNVESHRKQPPSDSSTPTPRD
jgi:hypothetical protein